jgi:hypothetical protein
MRSAAVAFLCSALPAQNLSAVATLDGALDLAPRFAFGVEPELRLPLPPGPLIAVEVGTPSSWFWSYLVPPAGVFRDGVVERVAPGEPAEMRIPLRFIPPGVFRVRVLTALGPSDVIELRSY